MRVLILDDDAANRVTLAALLEDEGMQVEAVDSLAALRSAVHDSTFDVAVLDLHVGDGLGTEVVPALAARGTRVILMSGTGALDRGVAGVEATFLKGDAFAALLSAVRGSR
jgi:DNA-binding response OmpR family regulator